ERGAVLHQQPVGRDLRHPADEAHQENASAPAKRRERRVEELAADRVEAHVDALAVRQRQHALGQLLGGVVDGLVGAALARDRELLRRARGRDDPGAQRLADLHGRQADAARRPEHEQRLAHLEPPLPAPPPGPRRPPPRPPPAPPPPGAPPGSRGRRGTRWGGWGRPPPRRTACRRPRQTPRPRRPPPARRPRRTTRKTTPPTPSRVS